MAKRDTKKQTLDTSRWWLVEPHGYFCCVNDVGEWVDLNCPQARDDYAYWKSMGLVDDVVERTTFGYRYKSVVPMIRDCIVYAHNVRHGHYENYTRSETEAIMAVRVRMTKWLNWGDNIKH